MSFGPRLKELRTNKKLTQQQLGDIIHVSKVSVSGYENGTRTPDTDTLQSIANYFNVSLDYLVGRTKNPNDYYFNDSSIETIKKIYEGNDLDYLELIDMIQKLDKDEIKALTTMASVMISKKNKS